MHDIMNVNNISVLTNLTVFNKIVLNILLYKHIFIKQLKQIQKSNTRFRSLSGDMMTCFVQADVVGAGVEGVQRSVV